MSARSATDRNNLAYWFPRLQLADVPVPKTVIVPTDLPLLNLLDGEPVEGFADLLAELDEAALSVGGYPAFLRTGHSSHKHDWTRTCYLKEAGLLDRHVALMVDWSGAEDLPWWTWVVREYLPLRAPFTAFRGMPVAREFRCFIAGGLPQCRHFYWPVKAIAESAYQPSRMDWQALLRRMRHLTPGESHQLDMLASAVADVFRDNWSVDIAQREDGSWVVIDMAEAERSWHPANCPHAGGVAGDD